MTNVTGWNELFSGHMIRAAFVMYETAWAGWVIVILYLLFQLMLYLKTKSYTLGFIIGAIFISLCISASTFLGTSVLKIEGVQWIFVILVLQLVAVLVNAILSQRKF